MNVAHPPIFENGAAYERFMGRWSRLSGEQFATWLQIPPLARWVEIGCGTGAFTEVILSKCEPASVAAFDLSATHVEYARSRLAEPRLHIKSGDAMAIDADDGKFDVAVSALVLNFIPDERRALEEMSRVVRSGGTVACYVWDFDGGAHVSQHLTSAVLAVVPDAEDLYPSLRSGITSQQGLAGLFRSANLIEVETTCLTLTADFVDFEDYWTSNTNFTSTMGNVCGLLSRTQILNVQHELRQRLPIGVHGGPSIRARASAARGRVFRR
jgi:ubiquinone/menaquinone biosynthesis C-methylase UbiE